MRYLIIISLLYLLAGCIRPVSGPAIDFGIDSIANKWVPDKREAICNINPEPAGRMKIILRGETTIAASAEEIAEFLISKGYNVSDSIRILPDTSIISRGWGLVTVSVANIKGTPSHSGEMVSQAIMGTPVKILDRKGSWLLVQTPDHYLGWINDSGLEEMNEDELSDWKQAPRLIFTEKQGDIYSVDNEGIVSDIVAGSIVRLLKRSRDYSVIILPDGRTGRLPNITVTDFGTWCGEAVASANSMISFARTMTGSPYMWGGTSVKAPDCSGFVKTIYFMNGIILARDASQQFLYGKNVEPSADSLEAGDLVFFGSLNSSGQKRITHVGLYIGNTELIHSSGMVRVNSLDPARENFSSYLKQSILGARRYIGMESSKGYEYIALNTWYNIVD